MDRVGYGNTDHADDQAVGDHIERCGARGHQSQGDTHRGQDDQVRQQCGTQPAKGEKQNQCNDQASKRIETLCVLIYVAGKVSRDSTFPSNQQLILGAFGCIGKQLQNLIIGLLGLVFVEYFHDHQGGRAVASHQAALVKREVGNGLTYGVGICLRLGNRIKKFVYLHAGYGADHV